MRQTKGTAGQEAENDTLITINHGNIVANTTLAATATTSDAAGTPTLLALGIQPTDILEVNPVAALPAGIVIGGVRMSAAGTVEVTLGNVTVGAIDPPAIQYRLKWRRFG